MTKPGQAAALLKSLGLPGYTRRFSHATSRRKLAAHPDATLRPQLVRALASLDAGAKAQAVAAYIRGARAGSDDGRGGGVQGPPHGTALSESAASSSTMPSRSRPTSRTCLPSSLVRAPALPSAAPTALGMESVANAHVAGHATALDDPDAAINGMRGALLHRLRSPMISAVTLLRGPFGTISCGAARPRMAVRRSLSYGF